MLNWNQIYRYLNFEISYEDAGFDNAIKNWNIDDGSLIPHHDMLLPGELINGLNKILAGEITFAVFKKWSQIACSCLVEHINEPTGILERIFYQWENFNNYANKQNASKQKMISMIKTLKQTISENRDFVLTGLEEYQNIIDDFEKKKKHTNNEVNNYINALTMLADKGDFEARNYIGTMYYSGRIVPQDFSRAKELYLQASQEGSTQALINLGYIYYYARCGGEPNYEQAFNCFSKASKIGNDDEITEAMYKLSDMYDKGLFVRKQRRKAFSIVEELYEKELDKYDDEGFSQYLADLAIRMAKAYSRVGIYEDLYKSLHYYSQALYLLEERFDGKWFGDKQLIESCKKEIPLLKNEIYGSNYDGKTITLMQLIQMLNRDKIGFCFHDLIYDDERKELYLYLSKFGLSTLEHLEFTNSDIKLCLVIPSNRVILNLKNIETNKYGNGRIEIWPIKVNEDSLNIRWEISLSFFDDVDIEIARFSSMNTPCVYVGYIKDFDYEIVYKDERFSNPKGFDNRYIIKFMLDYGSEFLWSINEKAREKYGYSVSLEDLNISEKLKNDIKKMCEKYDSYVLEEVVDEECERKDQERIDYIKNIEKPIFDRLVQELGKEYLLIFDDEID